jgi:4-amino-4-deoxy-L-arabinose transferase-like glycosyltransferase
LYVCTRPGKKMIFQKNIFKDIRFWILFFLVIRLYGITNPPLEISHNWRQATGIMVARNFYETDANIFYPRVDDNEGKTGIVGMEFPVMNYLMYLISMLFGFENWYGRLINLIVSSVGVFYFYKITRNYFSEEHAFYSAMLLLISIWFSFSRKTMPDTFSISLFIIAVYYGLNYLFSGKWLPLLLFIIFGLTGCLSKIPSVYLFSIFIIPLTDQKILLRNKIVFAVVSVFILSTVYRWYFIWCKQLSETYGIWYNTGKSFSEGAGDITQNVFPALKRFYFDALSYTGFTAFIAGLLLVFIKKNLKMIFVFSITFAAFILYILKSGFFFYHHNYYIIPFVPVMCLMAGYALVQIKTIRFRQIALFIIIVEGIANQQHDFTIKDSEKYKLTLEKIADELSNRSDEIVINGGGNPQQLFFAHRKGWTVSNEKLTDQNFINALKEKGCKYIFINKNDFKNKLNYPGVFEDDYFAVYKL